MPAVVFVQASPVSFSNSLRVSRRHAIAFSSELMRRNIYGWVGWYLPLCLPSCSITVDGSSRGKRTARRDYHDTFLDISEDWYCFSGSFELDDRVLTRFRYCSLMKRFQKLEAIMAFK